MMDENTINRLLQEAINGVPIMTVYNMALKNIDIEAMQTMQDLTREELCANMAMGGFIAGIRFTLENLEIREDDTAIDNRISQDRRKGPSEPLQGPLETEKA